MFFVWKCVQCWRIFLDSSLGESTGVYSSEEIVWSKEEEFSTFAVVDTFTFSSDGDGLLDGCEINAGELTDYTEYAFRLLDGSISMSVNYALSPGESTVAYLEIDEQVNYFPYVDIPGSMNGCSDPGTDWM